MKAKTKVLVVDDNESLRDTFGMILKRKGYDVDTASDGVYAVDKFQTSPFDLVIMDIIMPRLNGVEALHKIKEIDPKTKVILMTAYFDEEKTRSARQEGAYQVLNKPVDISHLMGLIMEATTNPTVLLVDDDIDLCQTLSKVLELNGYIVEPVNSGEKAIKILQQRKCQLAIIDMKMPLMNGFETFLKLREIDSKLTTIMMTGYREEMGEHIEKARAVSATTCLYKPFDPAELVSLIGQLSERNKGGTDERQREHTLSR